MTHYRCKENNEKFCQKGKLVVSVAVIFALVALCAVYLFQVNGVVAKNFELHNLQKLLQQNQDKNQMLSISLMQIRSLDNLERAAESLNLVAIDKINYLKITSNFFALSR